MSGIKLEPDSVQSIAPICGGQSASYWVISLDKVVGFLHDVRIDDRRQKRVDFPFVISVSFLVLRDTGAQTEVVE